MHIVLNILVFVVIVFGEDSNSSLDPLEHVWWGLKGTQREQDRSIRPFNVEFEQKAILDLKQRLKNHRPVTPPLEEVGFDYGFNTNYLESWVQYWANDYDFKAQAEYLNQFPQFKTNIQGLDMHFLWVKPQVVPGVEVIPLLFIHGWPGTVRELYDCIPYLTQVNVSRPFALEVIVPSLPGFGFSSAAVRPGLGSAQMAVVLRNLMQRLGFSKYYIQGGDWGANVGANVATLYPEEVLGYHTNFAIVRSPLAIALWFVGTLDPSQVVAKEITNQLYPLNETLGWLLRESAYLHMHATKPDSLGVAMGDSPTGLLAYILQLISSATRKSNVQSHDGGLGEHYSRESLLDILTITWMTNSFTTSTRIYAESINVKASNSGIQTKPTPVPTWTLHAKDEIFYQSPIMLRFKFPNLLHSTNLDDGGHFLALEKPQLLADDVFQAIYAFKRWNEMKKYKDEL